MYQKDKLQEIINDIVILNEHTPVIVEGKKDLQSLRALGLRGEIITLNQGKSIFNICEHITHRNVIILVDWDCKGDMLLAQLEKGLKANDIRYDKNLRAKLSMLTKKEIKDVESLNKFVERCIK
jgi:5S rRNA maturation endonuclease (ribonuclease M5)